eukprot:5161460-Pyramimonas_sp.AAC.1
MTTASRLSPKVHLALQYLIRSFFRIENVVSVRLAKSIHKLPRVTDADSCTLAHYDNDVNPGLHYFEPECFDQGMSEFEELTHTPTLDGTAREASEAEPAHDDGRLSTIYEESEADLESHVMEVWYAEPQEERELLEAPPPEGLFTIPTQVVPNQSVLITVADEQRGHLPKWGRTRDSDIEETYYAP